MPLKALLSEGLICVLLVLLHFFIRGILQECFVELPTARAKQKWTLSFVTIVLNGQTEDCIIIISMSWSCCYCQQQSQAP